MILARQSAGSFRSYLSGTEDGTLVYRESIFLFASRALALSLEQEWQPRERLWQARLGI
jgi:hypothetical protein